MIRHPLPQCISAALLLSAALPLQSAPLTVGQGGAYATIQAAVDVAAASPGDDEIRIRTGTYGEGFSIPSSLSGALTVRGGYDAAFTIQVRNGAINTVIAPSAGNLAVSAHVADGASVTIADLTVSGAQRSDCAGLDANVTGNFTLDGVHVKDNTASASAAVRGGGACIDAGAFANVELVNSEFSGNTAIAGGTDYAIAAGGGLSLHCFFGAQCTIESSTFRENVIEPAGSASGHGGGIDATADDGAQLGIYDCLFEQNDFIAAEVDGVSARVATSGTAVAYVTGSQFRGPGPNTEFIYPKFEVFLSASGGSKVQMLDSLVAHGSREPLFGSAADDALLVLGQNTLADNNGVAWFFTSESATGWIYDNIFWEPVVDGHGIPSYDGTFELSQNLAGIDPGFLAGSAFDYSLRHGASSPAANTGFANGHPVGPVDIAGADRVQGAAVDIGAWESSDRVYADRFDP